MELTLSTASTALFSISKTLHCSTAQTFPTQLRSTSTPNTVFRRSSRFKSPVWGRLECVSSSAASASDDGGIGGEVKPNPIDDVSVLYSDVIILDVRGMTCGGCAASVKRILENQAQVSSASVNHTTETAIVWPVSEAKAIPNWQKVMGEELAKHVTTCGFSSSLRGEGASLIPAMEETEKGKQRWSAAIANLSDLSNNLTSIQKLLINKAVYVHPNTFNKASLISEQARSIKVLEQRVKTLEREVDAAISAAAHARIEKREAEAGQKAAELRAQEMIKELENTTKVFELHMEELRAKQGEISKRDKEIALLKTVIQTLGGNNVGSP